MLHVVVRRKGLKSWGSATEVHGIDCQMIYVPEEIKCA
jgi:hypothetical protein